MAVKNVIFVALASREGFGFIRQIQTDNMRVYYLHKLTTYLLVN